MSGRLPAPKVLGVKCAECLVILYRDPNEFYGDFALAEPTPDSARRWPDHGCFAE